MTKWIKNAVVCGLACVIAVGGFVQSSFGVRIRDVARLSTDAPNELEGMGLVMGLKGTGDGGDYAPAMQPLMEMMKHFDDQVQYAKDVKNANNVAIVSVTMKIPSEGARAGEKLDVEVTSIGGAKSLKGGRLFIIPMIAPQVNVKWILGWASGNVVLDDDTVPTRGIIRGGGVLIKDILPHAVQGEFTLVLHPNAATMETATAVADRINEEVSPQTDGERVAIAVDATSVHVEIPKVEQSNTTAFVARILGLGQLNISDPAKVYINTKSKTIVFTDEVELSPTMISQGTMTVTVASPALPATPGGPVDPAHPTTATLRDLETAFNLLKVSPDDRITIVKMLHDTNALKADLQME
ncbi:MAG TPA: flagellar basal body P-ring protein FlgI [Phycisphaerae bacterium]|nr:flagellar basal body P-ring protein FlgI [Phycisphaerae bacterium]